MSEAEGNDRKRRRLGEKECKPSPALRRASIITDLPDAVLKECLSFVGPGNYRYIAGTCHRFQEQHSFPKTTTWKSAVASVSCAKLCLKDEGPENQRRTFPMLLRAAASYGSVRVLQWALNDHSCTPCRGVFAEAGEGGHLDVIKWGEANGMDWFSNKLCSNAVRNGHAHMFEWIHQRGRLPLGPVFAYQAGLGGHIPVLQWMVDHNLLPTGNTDVWYGVVQEGPIHALDWLFNNDFPLYEHTVKIATYNGRVDVLAWAQAHGVIFTASACTGAAGNGHLDTLKWLRENDCPWDETTITSASRWGHAEIVQWAIDNGCPEPGRA